MAEEAPRSRVLVVGATGRLAAGHPTFALVRPHHLAHRYSDQGPSTVTLLQTRMHKFTRLMTRVN
jgi:hypothetical protein